VRGRSRSYTRKLDSEVVDACVLGDKIYVHARRNDRSAIIHAYSRDGTLLRSFGEVYRAGHRIVQRQLSMGRLECIAGHDVVLFAPLLLPEIRAYRVNGELLWWAEIEGYDVLEIRELGTGSQARPRMNGYHMVSSLNASLDEPLALLQIAHTLPTRLGERPPSPTLHTFVISADGRRLDYVGVQLDIIHEWSTSHAVTGQREPFPLVRLYVLDGKNAQIEEGYE
jgi:hypothetical protein